MRRLSFVLTALAAAALALAPALADARPGGGASSGSRGSRTYSAPPSTSTAPGQARQFDRTMTEPGRNSAVAQQGQRPPIGQPNPAGGFFSDRKSTRLNSSHANISYAVFCLKK